MKLKIYQIDAFTSHLFEGNPAAVVPLKTWISDDLMQKIASENNLAETVFYVKNDMSFDIRWFTPTIEVPLCGHATLAAAWVIFNRDNYSEKIIPFNSKSGVLKVEKLPSGKLELDFPAIDTTQIPLPDILAESISSVPLACYRSRSNYVLEYKNQADIIAFQPDFEKLKLADASGIIITAKGDEVDFVSRFFAPSIGINEDPATGSAHASLTPFWAKKLHKNNMIAHQLSKRGAQFYVTNLGERVKMAGNSVLYLEGDIYY